MVSGRFIEAVNTLFVSVPDDEKEYERVIAEGGTIVSINGELRVNGVLNITRSMGELFGKPMISSGIFLLRLSRRSRRVHSLLGKWVFLELGF